MSPQSEDRVPRRRSDGKPPSFGRPAEDATAEDFTIRGGQALHLVLHLDVIPSAESLEVLRAAVRETTRSAVLEGYAAAFAEMDEPGPEVDVDGGASPAGPSAAGGDGD